MRFIGHAAQLPATGRILFVDFHGTLSSGRLWESLPSREFEAVEHALFRSRGDLVSDWLLGRVGSEFVTQYLAGTTGLSFEYLWYHLVSSASALRADTRFENILEHLSAFAHVCVLTANMDSFHRFTIGDLPMRGVDSVVSSCILRCDKADVLCQLRDLKGGWDACDQPVVIDDSASLIVRARTLGMHATLTRNPEQTLSILEDLRAAWSREMAWAA